MKYLTLAKTALFALTIASTSVYSATQGTKGTTSTGSVDVSVDIGQLIKISNLKDIQLGAYAGGPNPLSASSDFCVYRNGSDKYNITMSGNGTANAFTLSQGPDVLPYSVEFVNGSTTLPVTSGTLIGNQAGANTTSESCSNGSANNASVTVKVENADLSAAPAGSYAGTLTVIVAPEQSY